MSRLLLAVVCMTIAGCKWSKPAPAPTPKTPDYVLDHAPIGRFVFTAGPTVKFALDTKTGLVCKTWNWSNPDIPADQDPLIEAWRGFSTERREELIKKMTPEQKRNLRAMLENAPIPSDVFPLCVNLLIDEIKTVKQSRDRIGDFDWNKYPLAGGEKK